VTPEQLVSLIGTGSNRGSISVSSLGDGSGLSLYASGQRISNSTWASPGTVRIPSTLCSGPNEYRFNVDVPIQFGVTTTTPLFQLGDISEISLAFKLFNAKDTSSGSGLSAYLWSRFSPQVRSDIEQTIFSLPGLDGSYLVLDIIGSALNSIIQNGSLYNSTFFTPSMLSPETVDLLNQNPSGERLWALNRYLLHDYYPSEISSFSLANRLVISIVQFPPGIIVTQRPPNASATEDPRVFLLAWYTREGTVADFTISISDLLSPIVAASNSNRVPILTQASQWANDGAATNVFPVDSSIGQIAVSLEGGGLIQLVKPNGLIVQAGDSNVSIQNSSDVRTYSIDFPVPGNWTIVTRGTGAFELNVTGTSDLKFGSLEFVELTGRPGHQGLFEIPGSPIVGETNSGLRAALSGDVAMARFEARAGSGEVLKSLSMSRGIENSRNVFFGQNELPASPFLIYAVGTNSTGQAFQRVWTESTRAQVLEVRPPIHQSLTPGQSNLYRFTVTNHGSRETFTSIAGDDEGYAGAATPSTFTLESGQSIDVSVSVNTPQGAQLYVSDSLTLSVKSQTDVSIGNQSTIVSEILPRPILSTSLLGGFLKITWTRYGVLETAENITGPWTEISSTENSQSVPISSANSFFRVRE
jgi:hypothetical protein